MLGGKFYIHTKTGNKYELLCISEHSETHESMVVYRRIPNYTGESVSTTIWVRPYDIFNELIEFNGKHVKRFMLI